ncbi:tRNA (guanosine(37)-N1)-methyltransferase TrmD [Helicobacter sp. 11S02629-2]|uniref:tRNA (guanosine(37)-N1)-methyltransferase TrmD n=1 Tax=Helicobacter sp. 11S02629-2 TaxID=1476195 RepID=UPI000BA65CF6|nr:tRNA (guanosine(37)-N1)-methyltransferase TrmD [Helicobacter sp. 11S02629-2]PAF45461.1 tRNA (guanosine(37)-N1)-methyltransferase TrmD [Helicobacter sp. 11S02629-2]
MKFSFITLFPELIVPYFSYSILGRACELGLIEANYINIRDYALNPYKKVDSALVGGGAGMVLLPNLLHRVLGEVKDSRILFMAPCGARFSQKDAKRLSKFSHISFVCARYEGFDERNIELDAHEVFSLGDFILTGGELAASAMADSIARQVKGVLGNETSLEGESFENSLLEAPNFAARLDSAANMDSKKSLDCDTKLDFFDKGGVPLEYLKGNHAKIADLKLKLSALKTAYFRPDLHQN